MIDHLKNFNLWVLVSVVCFYVFTNMTFDKVNTSLNLLEKEFDSVVASNNAIFDLVGVEKKDQQKYLKVIRNQRVFADMDCARCHTMPNLALPIRKITLHDALEVVRNGTEASKAGGMPLYKSRGKGQDVITDEDLKIKLELLINGIAVD